MEQALIFNMQRFSLHDGPGIRTLIFLKGCSLRCVWCSNPESISSKLQVGYTKTKCIGCGNCLKDCPTNATTAHKDLGFSISQPLCTGCGNCVAACPTKAKTFWGELIDADKLARKAVRDNVFYQVSGGGVTLGGGDPVLQKGAALEILKICKAQNVDTAIETAGHYAFSALAEIAPYCDTIHFDIKGWNPAVFKALVGGNLKLILENLKKLDSLISTLEHKPALIVRTPLIPNFNFQLGDFQKLAGYLKTLENLTRVEVMPFHNFGVVKYENLGYTYPLRQMPNIKEAEVLPYVKVLQNNGINARVLTW